LAPKAGFTPHHKKRVHARVDGFTGALRNLFPGLGAQEPRNAHHGKLAALPGLKMAKRTGLENSGAIRSRYRYTMLREESESEAELATALGVNVQGSFLQVVQGSFLQVVQGSYLHTYPVCFYFFSSSPSSSSVERSKEGGDG
jgi:hypothetical protein